MFKNYLTIAIRNLIRHKAHSLINILGLAIGMACCVLILLFVQDELSYDRFHKNASHIYRLTDGNWAALPMYIAPEVFDEVPAISYVRCLPFHQQATQRENKGPIYESGMIVDNNFLTFFTFPLLKGDAKTALTTPNSIAITQSMAHRHFGNTNPIGQTLTFRNSHEFTITAILKDVPSNTHFPFDFLFSFETFHAKAIWDINRWHYTTYTYLSLNTGYTPQDFAQQAPAFVEKYFGDERDETYKFHLQPLTDIHLHSHLEKEMWPNSNMAYVYIFSASALFILLIACINFMNLTTARSLNRAREVGMRKVVGAHKRQLIQQFLGESTLLATFALLITLILVSAFLPYLNDLSGKQLVFDASGWIVGALIGLTLLVGLFAGCYPAFYLSTFRPITALKSGQSKTTSHAHLRQGLVVAQFAISIALIIATGIIQSQLNFMQTKKLDSEKDHVVIIKRGFTPSAQYETLKQEFMRLPGVESVSASSSLPGVRVMVNGISFHDGSGMYKQSIRTIIVDHDFVQTLGLSMKKGRAFSKEKDPEFTYIMNEAAIKELRWESPIDREISWRNEKGLVVGIVENFHFASLHHKIEPLLLVLRPGRGNLISVRIPPQNTAQTLVALENSWRTLVPHNPFSYQFVDAYFGQLHTAEQRMGQVLQTFSFLAIIVACLGLFGLAAFTAEQRTKEIGVRKVLGASVGQIIILLSNTFVKLVLIANLIAWPIVYWAMNQWLADFAYRINIGISVFLIGGALAFLVALATIGYQAWKAARSNPIDALRYE